MEIAWFIGYFILAHFLLMQVFGFSTYHRYFIFALPVVIGFAIGAAWIMFAYLHHGFFISYLVLESIWLLKIGRKSAAQGRAMVEMQGPNEEQRNLMIKSSSLTRRYYVLSSATYLVVFSVGFLWFLNR